MSNKCEESDGLFGAVQVQYRIGDIYLDFGAVNVRHLFGWDWELELESWMGCVCVLHIRLIFSCSRFSIEMPRNSIYKHHYSIFYIELYRRFAIVAINSNEKYRLEYWGSRVVSRHPPNQICAIALRNRNLHFNNIYILLLLQFSIIWALYLSLTLSQC